MIILMRHAHTEAGKGRCIGRTEVPLSVLGFRQAAELPSILGECGFLRICTSPAERAQKTTEPLAASLGVHMEVIPGLNEMDMGTWDGLAFDDIRAQFPTEYARRGENFRDFRPPEGESFEDVAERATQSLKILTSGPQHVLAVTHAGVIRSVLCRSSGHTLNDPFYFKPGYTQCSVLEAVGGSIKLIKTSVNPSSLPSFLL